MKNLSKYFVVIAALFLASCEKETEGLSTTTLPCELALLGNATVLVELGAQYVEPGYEAIEDSVDVTAAVTVFGTVNANASGRYTLRYTVKNKDAVPTIAKRTIIVYDPASLTGFYKVSSSSYRSPSPSVEYKGETEVLIYQEESGAYFISDLFGGYYSVERDLGADYETSGTIRIDRRGEISLVSSSSTPWDDKFEKVTGSYDESSQTFTLVGEWNGYTFYLTLIKQ
ncbi:MAG: DUF5012 domain-containing protein [Prevotellaceae bacterium]|jgi:hypothetical protein|nr:DUF5012 domain-containing protein [Prevotellaceae bacterium]